MSRSKSVAYYYGKALDSRVERELSKRKVKRKKKGSEAKIRKKIRASFRGTLPFAEQLARSWRRKKGLPPPNCIYKPLEVLNKAAWDATMLMFERCEKS